MTTPISPQAAALLKVIRFAEGTYGPKGYSTMFGGGQFDPSKGHPERVIKSGGYASAAAGAYQFMPGTWRSVSSKLKLPDFSPSSQDLGALQLIRARGVDPNQPLTPQGLNKLAPEWASLPTLKGTSYYGQPVKTVKELLNIYQQNLNPASSAVPKKPQQLSQAIEAGNLFGANTFSAVPKKPQQLSQAIEAGNLFGANALGIALTDELKDNLFAQLFESQSDPTAQLLPFLLNQNQGYIS